MSIKALKIKPFSEVKNLELSYLDNSLSYKSDQYTTSESFNFALYNALDNFNDIKVNNYSYFFLGKKSLISDWLTVNTKENIVNGFITPIVFNTNLGNAYLYFNGTSVSSTPNLIGTWDNDVFLKTEDELISLGIDISQINKFQSYLFIVEYIAGTNKCYLKHIDGSTTFYLYNRKYNPRGNNNLGSQCDDLWFTTDESLYKKFGQFNYIVTDSTLMLSLCENDSVSVILNNQTKLWVSYKNNLEYVSKDLYKLIRPTSEPEKYQYYIPDALLGQNVQISEYGRARTIYPKIDTSHILLVDNKELLPIKDISGSTYVLTSTIYSNNNILNTDFINSSWISYNDRNQVDVNETKSSYNLENQCLFHLQYNNITNNTATLNIIPLKNNISPNNNVIRGHYLETSTINNPNVTFREYTSLETGTNQEFGTSTITLTYTFYDIEYEVNSGEDLVFKIKANSSEETGELANSLYPFINLNINDTKFVKNGAFGSTSPFLADKVKKLQKNTQYINNGEYLYTWLCQSKTDKYGIWLDRYYYPDIISKYDLLKQKPNFDHASFNNIIDQDYIKANNFLTTIKDYPYFDKQSDLVFEPNVEYVYSRIGKEEASIVLADIEKDKVVNIDNFTNDSVKTIDNSKVKTNGVFDLRFDMYLSNKHSYGLDIFSNSPNNGITIKNEKGITPFIYTFSNAYDDDNNLTNATINLLNYNYELIKSIDLEELYSKNEEISKLFLNNPFEDFVVVTSKSIYIVGYDLIIKERIDLSILDNNIILDGVIKDNKVYLLCHNDHYNHIFVIDLSTNLSIYETKRFSSISKLGYVINQDNSKTIYPLYYNLLNDNTEEGNLEFIGLDINNKKVYKAIQNDKYPLPLNLKEGTNVYLLDENANKFDKNYWYYAPVFDNTVHTSLSIKTIYVDQDNVIYAFPYTMLSNKSKENSLYGVREKIPDSLYQVENIDLNIYKSKVQDNDNLDIIFASYTKIFNIAVDSNNKLAILKLQSYKLNQESKVELILFDSAKRPIRSLVLGNTYDNLFALDALKIYNNGNMADYFTLIGTIYDEESESTSYHAILVDSLGKLDTKELPFNISLSQIKTVDYNKLLAIDTDNSLDFILNLPKGTLLNDKFVYTLDLESIKDGWYNIHIIINLNSGKYEVYLNEVLLPIKQSIIINKNYYNLKNVFNYPFILGTTVYRNAISLNQFLKLTNNLDAINLRLKNFKLYAKELTEQENQALILSYLDITKPLIITLPGGQKNNIEEIIRYFKYNPPSNISNTVRINIKNSGIDNEINQNQLALEILKKINEELACPLTIKEINFI